ncbi:MAG TPA: cytochrome P450, partial [Myxococcaceae bacterium]|nr:cytochrome P450 [Myxococcaceae bacterium]
AADTMVRDETITMFSAGHETIANCLAWTFYLLSEHPDVESRLHAEVDALPGVPTFEDVARLRFTSMVLFESMRLYPPVWLMVRRPAEDFPLDGYVVPKGAYIHVSQFLMHRDARYFPDPLRFDPLRWTPEAEAARPKYCYFPFGGGGRKCIGEGFALAEGILVLATIARRFRLRLVPGHRVEPEPFVTLRPKYGMTMRLHRR